MLKTTIDSQTTASQSEASAYRRDRPADSLSRSSDSEISAARASDRADPEGGAQTALVDPAMESRIDPEEFAEALQSLEKRRHQVFTGTLPLAETLRELGVEVSPNEVWQEVQSNRAQKSTLRRKKGKDGRQRLVQGAVGLAALAATGIAIRSYLVQSDLMRAVEQERRGNSPPVGNTPHIPLKYDGIANDVFNQVKTPTMKPLSAIKDGEVIPGDINRVQELQRLTNGDINYEPLPAEMLKDVYVETKQHPGDFPIVRLNGKWYVRGYTNNPNPTPADSDESPVGSVNKLVQVFLTSRPQAHTTKSVTIPAPSPPPGTPPKIVARDYVSHTVQQDAGPARDPISVRGDAFSGFSGGGSNFERSYQLSLDPAKIDDHFHDKWDPLPRLPEEDPNFVRTVQLKNGMVYKIHSNGSITIQQPSHPPKANVHVINRGTGTVKR